MNGSIAQAAQTILHERFHRDALIALSTHEQGQPFVRAVNAFYEDGAFYVITHAQSNKMRQIENDPRVAICGDWFTAQGVGENLGHVLRHENRRIADKLRAAFASWYHNGHICEADPNTCILRIRLTHGVLMAHGTKYELDWTL